MFFLNLHRNNSNKHISLIAKIILGILLFCVLSDKSGIFSAGNFTRIQTFNFDVFVNELFVFTRFSPINPSFFMALGIVSIAVAVLLTITCSSMSINKETSSQESVEVYSYKVENVGVLNSNNIYLLTNKLIC